MLAIRMQRTGRSGHAMFRLVVQDARRSPTSGSVVAYLGSYDPHTKRVILDKTKAASYLEHGAQPSPRVAGILKTEKVKLPKWVEQSGPKKRAIRHPEKRRSTAPEQAVAAEPAPSEAESATEAEPADVVEAAAATAAEVSNEDAKSDVAAEEPSEAPAEEAETSDKEAPVENSEEPPVS